MIGRIFSIEEFSTFDGPGIRMTVFLKGCSLRCIWCHNPEGQNFIKEYYRSPNGCVGCNKCLVEGKLTKESIFLCKRNLIRQIGDDFSEDELIEKILKNEKILKMNGGGVTFSGGEPTMQREFLIGCLKKLKGKIHTCVQTCGFSEDFSEIIKNADMILYDLKLIDNKNHIRYCGVDNKIIIENYKLLAKSKASFVTRVPLITGIVDTKENITEIAQFMKEQHVNYVEVLKYNDLAGAKYKGFLREYDLKTNFKLSCDYKGIFADYGIEVKEV